MTDIEQAMFQQMQHKLKELIGEEKYKDWFRDVFFNEILGNGPIFVTQNELDAVYGFMETNSYWKKTECGGYECRACGDIFDEDTNYCPNCGRRMNEEEE